MTTLFRIERGFVWCLNFGIVLLGIAIDSAAFGTQMILDCAKDIFPERVTWLWPGRIALGKFTVFAGDPGLGKSAVSLDVVARVTTNQPFADGTHPEPGGAIILSAEDDAADTLRPRLDAAGADVSKVHIFRAVKRDLPGRTIEESFNLTTDLPPLEEALRTHPDVRLIVIDPISAYLGKTDTHRTASMRGVLAPLARLAADHNVAILGIDHLNKSDKRAIYRVSGSIATVAASRSAWVFVKDKTDETLRLMLPLKNNLAKDQEGLAYRIEEFNVPCENKDPIPTIQVAWEKGTVRANVDELLSETAEKEDASALAKAMDWLKGQLVVPRESAWLMAQAEREGLSWSTVKRAQLKLGIKPEKVGDHWMWPAIKKTERLQ